MFIYTVEYKYLYYMLYYLNILCNGGPAFLMGNVRVVNPYTGRTQTAKGETRSKPTKKFKPKRAATPSTKPTDPKAAERSPQELEFQAARERLRQQGKPVTTAAVEKEMYRETARPEQEAQVQQQREQQQKKQEAQKQQTIKREVARQQEEEYSAAENLRRIDAATAISRARKEEQQFYSREDLPRYKRRKPESFGTRPKTRFEKVKTTAGFYTEKFAKEAAATLPKIFDDKGKTILSPVSKKSQAVQSYEKGTTGFLVSYEEYFREKPTQAVTSFAIGAATAYATKRFPSAASSLPARVGGAGVAAGYGVGKAAEFKVAENKTRVAGETAAELTAFAAGGVVGAKSVGAGRRAVAKVRDVGRAKLEQSRTGLATELEGGKLVTPEMAAKLRRKDLSPKVKEVEVTGEVIYGGRIYRGKRVSPEATAELFEYRPVKETVKVKIDPRDIPVPQDFLFKGTVRETIQLRDLPSPRRGVARPETIITREAPLSGYGFPRSEIDLATALKSQRIIEGSGRPSYAGQDVVFAFDIYPTKLGRSQSLVPTPGRPTRGQKPAGRVPRKIPFKAKEIGISGIPSLTEGTVVLSPKGTLYAPPSVKLTPGPGTIGGFYELPPRVIDLTKLTPRQKIKQFPFVVREVKPVQRKSPPRKDVVEIYKVTEKPTSSGQVLQQVQLVKTISVKEQQKQKQKLQQKLKKDVAESIGQKPKQKTRVRQETGLVSVQQPKQAQAAAQKAQQKLFPSIAQDIRQAQKQRQKQRQDLRQQQVQELRQQQKQELKEMNKQRQKQRQAQRPKQDLKVDLAVPPPPKRTRPKVPPPPTPRTPPPKAPPLPDLGFRRSIRQSQISIISQKSSYVPTLWGMFLPPIKAEKKLARQAFSGLAPRPQVKFPKRKRRAMLL